MEFCGWFWSLLRLLVVLFGNHHQSHQSWCAIKNSHPHGKRKRFLCDDTINNFSFRVVTSSKTYLFQMHVMMTTTGTLSSTGTNSSYTLHIPTTATTGTTDRVRYSRVVVVLPYQQDPYKTKYRY